jgi:hypothetical protein
MNKLAPRPNKVWHQPDQKMAISRIERWQSAELTGGNQPHQKMAISRIESWQSAALKAGNQPH